MTAVAVALTALLAAAAPDWATSFAPTALRTYLPPACIDLLLVSAGEPREGVRGASAALQQALIATGMTRAVLDDSALGELAAVPDTKILELARDTPVQLIAVVRVTTATARPNPLAVVTFYGRSGRVWRAFTAEAGVALAPFQAEAPRAAVPVDPDETAERMKRRAREEAQDAYEQQYVWFADEAVVYLDTGRIATRWTAIFQGKYRVPLEGTAFYDLIGREDLARRYRTRRNLKLGLLLGGAATTAAGAGLAVYGLAGRCTKTNVATGECLAHDSKLATTGGVVAGAGLLVMFASATFGTHPIDGVQARKLADEYNKALKRSLGLLATDEPVISPAEQAPMLALDVGLLEGPATVGFELRW